MNRRTSDTPELDRRSRWLPAVATTLALVTLGAACGGSTGPEPHTKTGADLLFLRPASGSPPLLTHDTSFVATRGRTQTVELYYEDPEQPGQAGERFLRFKLEDTSLQQYPPGHPRAGAAFQDGDTITISIHVPQDTLLARFEPSGLKFNPDAPARLELRYVEADRDYDGDGTEDPELDGQIDLWKQELPSEPWTRIGTVKDASLEEIQALLTSFTRYALAI